MSDEQTPEEPGRSFGSVAECYDRGRPGYPAQAVEWLVNGDAKVVLELGAGTGKLTRRLVDAGHAVFATDPDPAMLRVLEERVPEVSAKLASAEDVPVNDRSVDVVVVAQAFHWFDADRALREIARVLKPGGHLALVWNVFDERIPWVRRLVETLGRQNTDATGVITDVLDGHELFEEVQHQEFTHWQDVDRDLLVDVAASRSYIAALPEAERESRLDAVRELYDEYGRGHDGMQLPYRARCFRARVRSEVGEDIEAIVSPDGTDGDVLLIDFR